MSMPREISELIERFDRNREAYLSGQYNETQLRREFLDPLFISLGWDIDNKQGYAEAYKDVIHEDAIKIGGVIKAPDYCFRIGGTKKFFVEAKKPSVKLKDDISPAFQLRRYAWSAKLPLSILTDFEEFAVYDCRVKPVKTDKASTSRILYLTYKEFAQRWDEISSVFSRDAVLKSSFDKHAEKGKHKKGTAEVDNAFLEEIEIWRDMFARNIALRNPGLTQRELNFAVQRIIDRIIFLRICEDRGIEEYGRLMALLNGVNVYKRLFQIFRNADERYNSGLFHFEKEKGRHESPDDLTPSLDIDDKLLKEIIKRLYYPESPYEFSVLPADILGQVYEQFLGKVIRLTSGHRAIVEEKPEVRKAGGVYYTPTYIVDYIVKNTAGRLVGTNTVDSSIPTLAKGGKGGFSHENITPKEVSKIRILDPACGSGSFLLGAYQYLLDWHRDWYANNDPQKLAAGKNPVLYQPQGGDWHLTTAEKKRILLNNIYGVDIDSQAVEVTKLSLVLKVLEGESNQTLERQLKFFHERALPDLGDNIKCGNSLIGSDFYDMELFKSSSPHFGKGGQGGILDEEERYRINVFDWNAEFSEIMKRGGFDAVIGNPPYIRQEMLGNLKEYFQAHYEVYQGTADLYAYFIERGISLLNDKGVFSFIVANKWMRANYGGPLRQWLKKQPIAEIIDFGDLPVFEQATTYPCILSVRKLTTPITPPPSAPPLKIRGGRGSYDSMGSIMEDALSVIQVKTLDFESLPDYVSNNSYTIDRNTLDDNGWSLANESVQKLLNKLKATGVPLGEYVKGKIYRGVLTGLNEAFVIDRETKERLIAEDPKSAEVIKPFLAGRDIKRYQTPEAKQYLIFTRRGIDMKHYPAIEAHLRQYKDRLMPKPKDFKGDKWKGRKPGSYKWYEIQDSIDYYAEFENPKIAYAEIAIKGQFTVERECYYSDTTSYIMGSSSLYLLGLLNSEIFSFMFSHTSSKIRGGFHRWKKQYMEILPIPQAPTPDPISPLVEQMLSLNKKLASAKTDHEKTSLQRQIDATDKQIDRVVYELYGLTGEEIRIVEDVK